MVFVSAVLYNATSVIEWVDGMFKLNGFSRAIRKSAVIFGGVLLLLSCDNPTPPPATVAPEETPMAPETTETLPQPSVLTRGMYSDFQFNPHHLENDQQQALLHDLFEGLVIYDSQGKLFPGVAEHWETSDNKNWVFILREDAKWSNGEPLTAADFVRSWRELATSRSPLKTYLAFLNLKNANEVMAGKMPAEKLGIEALDERILRIVLDKKTPYLPAMLTHSVLLPSHPSSEPNQIIGNGAYQFVAQQGDTAILARNPYYWGNANVYFDQVNYRKIASDQMENNLDLIENVQNITPETTFLPKLCIYFYEFNFADPMLAKNEVRKALRAMLSVRNLVPQDGQRTEASVSFLPQSMQPEQEGSWEPTLVENLLQAAGINDKSPLQLTLTFDQDSFHPQIAQRLIQAWSQSDMIRIHANPVSWQTLLEKRAKGDFQIIRSGWCADYNDLSAFLINFYSKSPDNKSGYANSEVDQLLEKSMEKISTQERESIYNQIVQLLKNDNVVLPIFQYRTPISANPDLLGIDNTNPTGMIYSKDLRRAN